MADLLELQGGNTFRIRAYTNAARTVEDLPEPVAETAAGNPDALAELPGIGKDLAGKIAEIVRTGTFKAYKEVRREVPRGLTDLMRVPGLGPKKARALYDALGIHTLRQLEKAANQGRIRNIKGFGGKTEERILRELARRSEEGERTQRAVAAQYAEAFLAYLRGLKGVKRAEIAGSYRRCRDTVGDLDILVTAGPRSGVVEKFTSWENVSDVLAAGDTKASVRLRSGLQVDLRVLKAESYGAGLYYFTGSKSHNIAVRRIAQRKGLKINEYGVFRGRKQVAGRDEEDVFQAVGLPWIPPELRENRGEIEAARDGRLPDLVELRDMRGDLQSHTTDSDGRNTLEEMARAAEERGHEYFAVTDHSPALRMVQGLDRAGFRRQGRDIDKLNRKLGKLTVLRGAEVDILRDGTLDLDDETLAELDVVVISVHSFLDLPEGEQTRRLVRAVSHPSADILGHPTGRIIGKRRGMRFDFDQVVRAAVDNGVILEINAQPDRLDFDDVACHAVLERGGKISISTDAHAIAELDFMRWGVDQARRGWARKKDVVNTLPLSKFRKLLHGAR